MAPEADKYNPTPTSIKLLSDLIMLLKFFNIRKKAKSKKTRKKWNVTN